jgi:predicted nuclease of restriction endonuclease-like (RecB) superfamily
MLTAAAIRVVGRREAGERFTWFGGGHGKTGPRRRTRNFGAKSWAPTPRTAQVRNPIAERLACVQPRDCMTVAKGYGRALAAIKARIRQERVRVVLQVNQSLILLYWDIGRAILGKQGEQGWGARVIDRLSCDLQEAFPEMSGFSPRNLLFMRSFAAAFTDERVVKQLVSQLPWGHCVRLLQRVKDARAREWCARATVEHGWSRSVLESQIDARVHDRRGRAVTNFRYTLPSSDSDLATQTFKDPYLFDFLGTADLRREREVEQALVDHIQRFLIELGSGFAFVGRQVPIEVDDHELRVDLLFYHLTLRRYVVIELKAVPFDPAFIGQLNAYLSAVEDRLRHSTDQPTIGLLLCRTKSRLIVEYALRNLARPIGVAEWETQLVHKLPRELRSSLPTIAELERELTRRSAPAHRTPRTRRANR